MSIKHLLVSAANIANTVLGDTCTYENRAGDFTNGVHVTIDKNKIVPDSAGFIAGYSVEASLLKSEVPKVYNKEFIIEEDGTKWEITQITKETSAKWYVDIVEVH